MKSAELRHRINIEQRSAEQDTLGQPVDTWTLIAAVWADVRNAGGLEAIKAGGDVSIVRASIRIRYLTGLDAGMRVVHGAVVYQIKAVLPDLLRKQYVDLVCEVVQ